TLLLPDGGRATVMGHDVVRDMRAIRSIAGYMPERFSLYQDMSVEENLRFFATLFRTTVEENYDLIKDIYSQIEPFRKRRAGALSGGMKQKLALSCALIHRPEALFLDEPTTGVDPVSRSEFWQMLGRLREQNITIMVSTPNMDEAAQCDRIALVREGRFLKIDTPAGVVDDFRERLWAVRSDRMHPLLADLRSHPQVHSCFAMGGTHHITVGEALTESVLASYLAGRGHTGVVVEPARPTIEDCFMLMTEE
ncbi:MAG: ABC transporter ATP-binding protein, partial [Rikenellaceae bacterium]|nr:ABC transporter ATP-binding protein [Rikenellaceae bacterium]